MLRLRIVLAVCAAGFLASSTLYAEEVELKPKKIKLSSKNADIFPEIELSPQESLPDSIKEPKYRFKWETTGYDKPHDA